MPAPAHLSLSWSGIYLESLDKPEGEVPDLVAGTRETAGDSALEMIDLCLAPRYILGSDRYFFFCFAAPSCAPFPLRFDRLFASASGIFGSA